MGQDFKIALVPELVGDRDARMRSMLEDVRRDVIALERQLDDSAPEDINARPGVSWRSIQEPRHPGVSTGLGRLRIEAVIGAPAAVALTIFCRDQPDLFERSLTRCFEQLLREAPKHAIDAAKGAE